MDNISHLSLAITVLYTINEPQFLAVLINNLEEVAKEQDNIYLLEFIHT